MQWISVQECLPADDKGVLVLCRIDDPYMRSETILWEFRGYFNRGYGWRSTYAPTPFEVRYWMPLPSLPEGESRHEKK